MMSRAALIILKTAASWTNRYLRLDGRLLWRSIMTIPQVSCCVVIIIVHRLDDATQLVC